MDWSSRVSAVTMRTGVGSAASSRGETTMVTPGQRCSQVSDPHGLTATLSVDHRVPRNGLDTAGGHSWSAGGKEVRRSHRERRP